MKAVHGERMGHGATGQWHGGSPVINTEAKENRAALCNSELSGLLGAHFLSGVGRGRRAGDDGESLGI